MKIKIRKTGTPEVIFEGNVENTVFPEGVLNLQWFDARTIEGQTEVELSVFDYVYPYVTRHSILNLHKMKNDAEASVFQALNNRRTNGYPQQPSALAEVESLVEENADLKHCNPIDLIPYANRWRNINW